jgi:hypothetical protein
LSTEIKSTNPVVKAIIGGTAPQQARLAAASGLLPLAQSDLLEVLVSLRLADDSEIAAAARGTLESQDAKELLAAAKSDETSVAVLDYLATSSTVGRQIHEAVILNSTTSDQTVASLPQGSGKKSAGNEARVF